MGCQNMPEICQILASGQKFFSPARSLQKNARFAYFWPANMPSGNYAVHVYNCAMYLSIDSNSLIRTL